MKKITPDLLRLMAPTRPLQLNQAISVSHACLLQSRTPLTKLDVLQGGSTLEAAPPLYLLFTAYDG